MSEFRIYLEMGRDHILDYVNGYDHILFIIALCSLYMFKDWKKLLVLVTAFTLGHSTTLALAVLGIIAVNTDVIEFLIPLTIFITACSNLFRKKEEPSSKSNIQLNYLYALFFGLVHGMGFSSYLKSILGSSENLVAPLFAFNLGLELGQVFVVIVFLSLGFIVVDVAKVNRRDWRLVISSFIAGMSVLLMKANAFW